jgi:glycerol-3-phosphate acyltransferase PlsY
VDWEQTGMIAAVAIVAYLIGSFPSAYLVGRFRAGIDVRTAGEGNVGARNVFHQVGSGWGILVFALDFGKGAAVALLLVDGPAWRLVIGAVFLIVGHAYPVWLRFVGGKGLAAAGGFAAALMPLAFVGGATFSGLVWLATHRFLPTLIGVTVTTFVLAPFTGVPWHTMAIALIGFLLTAAKRVVDEPRMRRIEAETGWNRATGGTG